jgi:AcrR family transcriptional regulator
MCDTGDVIESRSSGVRARLRAETTEEIKRIARRHLAEHGPDLSLRAVARELGVVSSAVYRYFESRDRLLTALIIDAYNDLGTEVETAEAAVARRELLHRWLAACRAARTWSRAHPAEYGLLYGTPVPGYAAPADTIAPASRPVVVLTGILRDGVQHGELTGVDRVPAAVRADLTRVGAVPGFGGVPPAVLARGMMAWTEVFGAISFELFGRLTGAITDYDAWFDHQLRTMAGFLGLLK